MHNTLDTRLSIKKITDGGEFEGYGSMFNVKDRVDDIVVPGAFAKSLQRHKEKGTRPSMLWDHRSHEPIGVWDHLEEDADGLFVKGHLLMDDDPLARKVYSHLKAKSVSGLSIGYIPQKGGVEYNSEHDALMLKELDLLEISIVSFPTNEDARVQSVKNMLGSGMVPDPKYIERHLRDAGFSRQQAKSFMAHGYKGLNLREADEELLETINSMTNTLRGMT